MTNHFTDEQVSRWILGRATAADRHHAQGCSPCAIEIGRLQDMVGLLRTAIYERADRQVTLRPPSLSAVLGRQRASSATSYPSITGRTVEAPALRSKYSAMFSILAHAAVIGILMIPVAILTPAAPLITSVMLLSPPPLTLELPQLGRSAGGGGGGMKTPTPPSKGVPPRGADRQLVPPMIEARNLAPELAVEPTIVSSQLAALPLFTIQALGDPNGVAGPPSAGPGIGGGIGTGAGRGVGDGTGPGQGIGDGGGLGGGIFAVGGGVSEPRPIFQPQPEYSDDARKARAEGTVEMMIVVKADGTVEFEEFTRRLGFGLDQKASEAVRRWRFSPALRDGKPVNVRVTVVVNFALR